MALFALNFYEKYTKIYPKNAVLLKNFTYIIISTIVGLILMYKLITNNLANNNFNIEVTAQIMPVYFLYRTLLND